MAENTVNNPRTYLHGDLYLHIIEARRLPNVDVLSENLRRCFTACDCSLPGAITTGNNVHPLRPIIASDAYVKVLVPHCTLARTSVINNSPNPKWDQKFNIPLAHPMTELEFLVKDDDIFGAEIIGSTKIPARNILSCELISGWFPILSPSTGKPPKRGTALHMELKFIPFGTNPAYQKGAGEEVPDVYFPMRKGNKVKLYQDAHVTPQSIREVVLEGEEVYKQGTCWEDICYAISEAHHLVYIVGWSVFHKIKLIREPTKPLPQGGILTLGELLQYKSEEGVRVLLLVWDDHTSSNNKVGISPAGVMQTRDEETKKFFKHSSVTCVLARRYASSKLSFIKKKVVGTVFTHHQKCVLVDTQASGNDRKITAFLGGIDLCDGRYDTPEHRLFRDLETVFKDDFYNATFPAATKAPRQPWHDLHCRIDGPAAYDVLINFEQRWRKATKWTEAGLRFQRVSHYRRDALIKMERISWIRSPPFKVTKDGTTIVPRDHPAVYVTDKDAPDTWHVQIFRSIDSGSLKGFPKTVEECDIQHLLCAKGLIIDKSIQNAYIKAIRSAQHFIYIENQYFLGSSFAWPSYKDAGADNLVPVELALKIASKIRAKERFAVYVVLPMWPEGNPQSEAMQEILFWQSQTMQMMYEIVAWELKSMQTVDSHPQDFLNFYCLGKREELPQGMSSTSGDMVSDAQKSKRFMIYVHAKGMVVDDEYVIVGSANINQRSMAGTKDTELAMGAYQPHHTWAAKKSHPRGQVYGYRMSLWAEHLGGDPTAFPTALTTDPESLECVKMVNNKAEENWKKYANTNFTLLEGHLLKYPVLVHADGKVGPLAGYETFPDVGGKVIGAHSIKFPDILTT